jgi:hypothetical protein
MIARQFVRTQEHRKTAKFEEVVDSNDLAIGSVYIRHDALAELDDARELVIVITRPEELEGVTAEQLDNATPQELKGR